LKVPFDVFPEFFNGNFLIKIPRKANIPFFKYEVFRSTMVDEKKVAICQFHFGVLQREDVVEMILMIKKQPLENGKKLVVYVNFGCVNNDVPSVTKGVPFFMAFIQIDVYDIWYNFDNI